MAKTRKQKLLTEPKLYEVEKIVGRRMVENVPGVTVTEFLIKWKDYPDHCNTWEAGDNLTTDLVNEAKVRFSDAETGVPLRVLYPRQPRKVNRSKMRDAAQDLTAQEPVASTSGSKPTSRSESTVSIPENISTSNLVKDSAPRAEKAKLDDVSQVSKIMKPAARSPIAKTCKSVAKPASKSQKPPVVASHDVVDFGMSTDDGYVTEAAERLPHWLEDLKARQSKLEDGEDVSDESNDETDQNIVQLSDPEIDAVCKYMSEIGTGNVLAETEGIEQIPKAQRSVSYNLRSTSAWEPIPNQMVIKNPAKSTVDQDEPRALRSGKKRNSQDAVELHDELQGTAKKSKTTVTLVPDSPAKVATAESICPEPLEMSVDSGWDEIEPPAKKAAVGNHATPVPRTREVSIPGSKTRKRILEITPTVPKKVGRPKRANSLPRRESLTEVVKKPPPMPVPFAFGPSLGTFTIPKKTGGAPAAPKRPDSHNKKVGPQRSYD